MKIKLAAFLVALLGALTVGAGTLMYKTSSGEVKTVSQVTLISIDNRRVTIKIGTGTEVIGLNQVVKYYNTNIKGGEFEDETADYTVSLNDIRCPATGYTGNKKTVSEFSVSYSVMAKKGETSPRMRHPYFYLSVLTTGSSAEEGREVYSFAFPERAKVAQKNYDEAKMLEKVIDLDRPTFYPGDGTRLGVPTPKGANRSIGGARTATIKLAGIGNRTIIAWRLVVWGKNEILEVKDSQPSSSFQVGNNWWLR